MSTMIDRDSLVAPKSQDHLELMVRDPDGGTHSVQLTDLTISECEFLCPAETRLVLHVGSRAELCFSTPVLQEPLEVLAPVVCRSESESGRRYRLRFPPMRKLPASVYALFNRRSSYRVSPSSGSKLIARVRAPSANTSRSEESVSVRDISATGISLELGKGGESIFGAIETILLDLVLPGTEKAVQLVGKIRNRRLDDDRLVYGIEFDPEESKDFSDQQAVLRDYVFDLLQVELKRSGAESSRLGSFL